MDSIPNPPSNPKSTLISCHGKSGDQTLKCWQEILWPLGHHAVVMICRGCWGLIHSHLRFSPETWWNKKGPGLEPLKAESNVATLAEAYFGHLGKAHDADTPPQHKSGKISATLVSASAFSRLIFPSTRQNTSNRFKQQDCSNERSFCTHTHYPLISVHRQQR